jgi:hypothetical protein
LPKTVTLRLDVDQVAQLHHVAGSRADVEALDRGRIASILLLEPRADVEALPTFLEGRDVQAADHHPDGVGEGGRVHAQSGGLLAIRDHPELGEAELQALVQVDVAAALLELGDELVGQLVQPLEGDVAAQLEAERALVAAARLHGRGVVHVDLLARDRPEHGTCLLDEVLGGALAIVPAREHGEHDHLVGVGPASATGRTHGREEAGHLRLLEHPRLVPLEVLDGPVQGGSRSRLGPDEEEALVRGREELLSQTQARDHGQDEGQTREPEGRETRAT